MLAKEPRLRFVTRTQATIRLKRNRPAHLSAWLAMLLLVVGCWYRPGVASAQNLAFMTQQAWSTEEGLPQASVHQILQSEDGYLWLATEGGVARFDGISWKSFTHETAPAFTSDDISSIAEVPKGVMWFGTSDGLIRMEGTSVRRFARENGLPSSTILSLAAVGRDALLALTTGGLARVDALGLHAVKGAPFSITSIDRTADGSVWLLARDGLFRYTPRSIVPVFPTRTAAGEVLGVQTGAPGAVWLRTAQSVTRWSGTGDPSLTVSHHFAGSRLQALLVDREGTAWVGTKYGLFTLGSEPSAHVSKVEALGTESVLSLFEDREGDHWIGTENSGLHVLRERKFRSETGTLGEGVTAVVQASDGVLWFGTRDEGLGFLKSDGTEAHLPDAALTSPVILSLAPGPHGEVWAGTPDGLNRIEHGRVRRYTSTDGLPDDFVRSVLVSHDGSVWAGTRYGLAHLDHAKITTLTRRDGLASDSIGPILESSSTLHQAEKVRPAIGSTSAPDLWIGTAAGLTRISQGHAQNFSPVPALPGTIVTAIAQDRTGVLWVAVHNAGLSRFADGTFQQISLRDLPTDIRALMVDPAGYLWLRGRRGVDRVAIQALNACIAAKEPCHAAVGHYGVSNGMPSDEAVAEGSPPLWQGERGTLWVCTRKGLAVADTLHLPVNTVPPPVVLQRFAVDDQEQPLTTGNLRIDSGHRSFTFDYAGLSFVMPSRTRYRYKLEGFDRDWVEAGTRRTAYYTSLPGRRYRFRVTAANNDGVWNEAGADLRFTVLPPLYLRWWFYVVLALLLFATVGLAFQARLRRVRLQFALVLNERNRVAREIHDTLAQDFVSVSLQLELIAQMISGNKLLQASEQINETRSLVKEGLEAARQSIWDLRANAAQNALPARLRRAVENFAQQHTDAQVRISGLYRKLSASLENEVLRIAEESLSNVDRHAAASKVLVELRYESDELALTVRDNGRGFVCSAALAKDGHYGLRGMQERALALGGHLTMASNPGEGTVITLNVPLREG